MNILTLDCETGNFLNSDGSVAGNFNDFLDPTGGQAEFCKDYVSTSTDVSKPSIFANDGLAFSDGRWANTNPVITSNKTTNDCITKVGDKICCYTSFSFPANIIFPKDERYSEYKTKVDEYLGTGGDSSAKGIYGLIGKIPFNYFSIILDYFLMKEPSGLDYGFVAFDYTNYGGTYDSWVSGSKKLHLASGIEQFGQGVHVDVGAFGESEQRVFVKHVLECTEFSSSNKTGKLTTKLYSSGGIELAETTKSARVSGSNIGWRIGPVDLYNHFIVPGLKWHQVVISTDDLDIKEFLPNKHFLDGDGLSVAWDIIKKWINKYKQDILSNQQLSNIDDIPNKANKSDLSGYLPLAGGQMTDGAIKRNVDDNWLVLTGGTVSSQSASLWLYGKDEPTHGGSFWLGASPGDSTSTRWLVGYTNGTLNWCGKNVDCIEEQGNGYIRYTNGIQICYGTIVTQTQLMPITFGKAFLSNISYSVAVCPSSNTRCWLTGDRTTTNITLTTEYGDGSHRRVDWQAIGTWK